MHFVVSWSWNGIQREIVWLSMVEHGRVQQSSISLVSLKLCSAFDTGASQFQMDLFCNFYKKQQ